MTGPKVAPPGDDLALAFAPLHKRRFGIACGIAFGLLIAAVTAIYLLRGPSPVSGIGDPEFSPWLLRSYFWGYSISWPGVLIGFGWGFLVGAIAGWFMAFVRNVVMALQVFLIRTRDELARTKDFLDHI